VSPPLGLCTFCSFAVSDHPVEMRIRRRRDSGLLSLYRFGIVTSEGGTEFMKGETNVSYLSAMYYTAAFLLVLTGVFAALSRSYGMATVWFILGIGLFAFRLFTSNTPD